MVIACRNKQEFLESVDSKLTRRKEMKRERESMETGKFRWLGYYLNSYNVSFLFCCGISSRNFFSTFWRFFNGFFDDPSVHCFGYWEHHKSKNYHNNQQINKKVVIKTSTFRHPWYRRTGNVSLSIVESTITSLCHNSCSTHSFHALR